MALVVDHNGRRLHSVLITGDFFAYPRRAILDLEAALKNAPADMAAIEPIVRRVLAPDRVQIPGISPRTCCTPLPRRWTNSSMCTMASIPTRSIPYLPWASGSPKSRGSTALLLPYCAKLPDCEYRYEQGCNQCGACSIGEAFALAERYGLRPVSIQNYEALEETLQQLRDEGVESFVGSCCEAFYAKHRDDFERIGLAGILVDVDSSTCYELGKEEDAYVGRFENQTDLKLDLLERVVRQVAAERER